MLTLSSIFKAQTKYGVSSKITGGSDVVSYEVYLIGCRRMLTDKTPIEYYNWDIRRQNDFTDNLIVSYVRNNTMLVDGFLDENGDLIQEDLITRLRIDIVDYGILREALEDDTIQEIQINDAKTIWVVRGGKSELFVDISLYQMVSFMQPLTV